jgi:hypothetical protein
MAGPDGVSEGGDNGGQSDGPTQSGVSEETRSAVEGLAARESFERREASIREMERAANEAALDQAVATREWTAEEQAALDRGTAQGVQDAAEGWVLDVVDGVVETATVVGQATVVGLNSGAAALADAVSSRAVEHKLGYQSLTRHNEWELTRDAALAERGWDISWTFDREPSAPLRQALEEANIEIEIREQ